MVPGVLRHPAQPEIPAAVQSLHMRRSIEWLDPPVRDDAAGLRHRRQRRLDLLRQQHLADRGPRGLRLVRRLSGRGLRRSGQRQRHRALRRHGRTSRSSFRPRRTATTGASRCGRRASPKSSPPTPRPASSASTNMSPTSTRPSARRAGAFELEIADHPRFGRFFGRRIRRSWSLHLSDWLKERMAGGVWSSQRRRPGGGVPAAGMDDGRAVSPAARPSSRDRDRKGR